MPNRILRDWTDSEAVNSLSAEAERFYVRLIQKADDLGRFSGNPKILRSLLFPLLDVTERLICDWVDECARAGLLVVYVVDGKSYVEIQKFRQRTRAMVSKCPPPPDARPSDDGHMTVMRQSHDRQMTCRDGDGDGDGDGYSSEPQAASEPAVMLFPTVGKIPQWGMTAANVESLRSAFPSLDVLAESRKALAWVEANPSRRKTARGMPRFLFGWMERAQNRGPPLAVSARRSSPDEVAAKAMELLNGNA